MGNLVMGCPIAQELGGVGLIILAILMRNFLYNWKGLLGLQSQ